jgi:hypothetical protein
MVNSAVYRLAYILTNFQSMTMTSDTRLEHHGQSVSTLIFCKCRINSLYCSFCFLVPELAGERACPNQWFWRLLISLLLPFTVLSGDHRTAESHSSWYELEGHVHFVRRPFVGLFRVSATVVTVYRDCHGSTGLGFYPNSGKAAPSFTVTVQPHPQFYRDPSTSYYLTTGKTFLLSHGISRLCVFNLKSKY